MHLVVGAQQAEGAAKQVIYSEATKQSININLQQKCSITGLILNAITTKSKHRPTWSQQALTGFTR